ncbi:MAG: ABC transporter substrate-binding protein [Coriobacteriales bacterium]|jgi:NitT/TauT family transport system substrate-binding protein|nr:ABC transporter substrate-binding protein [Coriobacteriales bacterium]
MTPAAFRRAASLALVCILSFATALGMLACSSGTADEPTDASLAAPQANEPSSPPAEDKPPLRVASLKGPTSIGLAHEMTLDKTRSSLPLFEYSIYGAGDEIVPLLVQGELDIALIPANLAATLYSKTEGDIQVIGINTLGVLYVVTGDASVTSIASLDGRSVYMTGKGTIPEYTIRYLLQEHGLSADDVSLEFLAEPSEVAARLAADPAAVGILPQPYAASVTIKNPELALALDLTHEWQSVQSDPSLTLVTGVTVARSEVIEQRPDDIASFLERQRISTEFAQTDIEQTATNLVELGIFDNTNLAEAAIPYCNIIHITGSELKKTLSAYLAVLYGQDSAAVGGALPGDDFYYNS